MELFVYINKQTAAVPLLGIYLKKPRTLTQKGTCILMFIATLCTIAKMWKQPNCPSAD